MIVPLEKPGTPEELAHHGVKGQKWGVRKKYEAVTERGSQAVSSIKEKRSEHKIAKAEKRETRAKKAESEAADIQKTIDTVQAHPTSWHYTQAHRDAQVADLKVDRDQKLKDAKDIRAGHLTDHQRHVAEGAAAVAVVLAAYGTYKMIDSGTAQQLLSKKIPLKENDLLSRKMSPDALMREVVSPINPNYGDVGTKMNCRRATFAYEMRRRGYDVKATETIAGSGQSVTGFMNATNPKNAYRTDRFSILANLAKEKGDGPVTRAANVASGLGHEPIGQWGRGLNNGIDKSDKIFEVLSEHPEGARGELGMRWRDGGAHSMAWEIIGGKPHIFDAQSGQHFDTARSFTQTAINIDEAGATRLDNMNLNTGYLRRWVRNVK